MVELKLSTSGKFLCLRSEYKDRERCKSIPMHNWHPGGKFWYYPTDLKIIQVMRSVFPELKNILNLIQKEKFPEAPLAEDYYLKNYEMDTVKMEDLEPRFAELKKDLMPFQKEGVLYASNKRKVFIADDMGLGKTVEGIASIHANKAYPALIIVPAVVKYNWAKEVKEWIPEDKTICVMEGKNDDIKKIYSHDVVVINYDICTYYVKELSNRQFKSMTLDESHYVKNKSTQRTKAVLKISKKIPYRFLLSGTPIENKPIELTAQLEVIDRLKDFGGWMSFALHYCNAYKTKYGWDTSGACNMQELNAILRSKCYIRRTKREVLKDLPDKRISKIPIRLSKKDMKEYQRALNDTLQYLAEIGKSEEEIERAARAESLVKIELLKQLTAKKKLPQAIEWIKDFLESGEKLLVFCTHKDVLKDLIEVFPSSVIINGETSAEERFQIVERFQTDPDVKLALLTLKAASVGITMTASSNVAFIELGWTPAEMAQAEDRVNRIGQKHPVNIWYLLAEETIDMEIAQLIDTKRVVAQGAMDGKEVRQEDSILKELSKNLLNKFMEEQKTKKMKFELREERAG